MGKFFFVLFFHLAMPMTIEQIPISGIPPPSFIFSRLAYTNYGVYNFGGTIGTDFSNDLWYYSTIFFNWTKIYPGSQDIPSPRILPVLIGTIDSLILFGGQTISGANGDLWVYNTTSNLWKKIDQQGDVPSPRLNSAFGEKENSTLYVYGGDTLVGEDNTLYM